MLILHMYLQLCVWYLGGIIRLGDKNEMNTLYDQNSTYNKAVYIPCHPFFPPSILRFDEKFCILLVVLSGVLYFFTPKKNSYI